MKKLNEDNVKSYLAEEKNKGLALLEKWEKKKGFNNGPELKSDWDRINMAKVMENVQKEVHRKLKRAGIKVNELKQKILEKSFAGDFAQLTMLMMPLARRLMPNLLTTDVVGTQVMDRPTGYVGAFRYGPIGENKDNPNMTSHYFDQGRMFKIRKSMLDPSNPSQTNTGDYVSVSSTQYTPSTGRSYDSNFVYEYQKLPVSIGDIILATTNANYTLAGGSLTVSDYVTQNVDFVGAWKIIAVIDNRDFYTLLTVAFPIGTLEYSETWKDRYDNVSKNYDFKNGFFKRATYDEGKNVFASGTYFYFCRDSAYQDAFRLRVGDNYQGYNSPPYEIYSVGIDLTKLEFLVHDDGAGALITDGDTLLPVFHSGASGSYSNIILDKTNFQYTHPVEAGYNKTYEDYSGPYTTHVMEQLGLNRNRRKYGIHVMKKQVEVMGREIAGEYSLEAMEDLQAEWGLDINSEYINILTKQIGQDIDRETLNRMFYLAETNTTDTIAPSNLKITSANFNNYFVGTDTVSTLTDQYRRFMNILMKMGEGISKDTMMGTANFAIVSPALAVMIAGLQNFNGVNIKGDVDSNDFGATYIGTVDGTLKIYKDLLSERKNDFALLGYKGKGPHESGLIYAPYIPVDIQQTQGEQSLHKNIVLRTRYAMVENIWGAEYFYRLFEIEPDQLSKLG